MSLKIFVPLTKVDIEKRLVYGTLAAEEPDRSQEVLDYASSKPHFEAWSSDISKATEGKSVGNLRAMHGKVAAGKFTDLHFDDEAKRIEAVAKVVDDTEWNKVLEGVYTGFSIGGKYGKTWTDNGLRRYEAIPAEGSLVDYPCIPSATFKVMKADGSEELRKFTAAGEAIEAVNQLAELLDQGKLDPREVLKLAMADLAKRNFNGTKEGGSEDDAAAKAAQAEAEKAAAAAAAEAEKTEAEKAAAAKAAAEEAAKAAAADALAKVGRRNSAEDQQYLQDAHDALVKAGAMCGGGSDDGDDSSRIDDDFEMAAGVDELCKAAGVEPFEGVTGLEKAAHMVVALSKAHARIAELEALPAPTKGVLKGMTKAQDMTANQSSDGSAEIEAELEQAAKAQIDGDPLPMVKFIHKYGARTVHQNGPRAGN
jgi:hypothetical protein